MAIKKGQEITALFTIIKICKQPTCLSADEWARRHGTYTQWDATQPRKRMVAIWNNMDGLGGYYVK